MAAAKKHAPGKNNKITRKNARTRLRNTANRYVGTKEGAKPGKQVLQHVQRTNLAYKDTKRSWDAWEEWLEESKVDASEAEATTIYDHISLAAEVG